MRARRQPAAYCEITPKLIRPPKHKFVPLAGTLIALCAQRVEAQFEFTSEQYSESATSSATDGTPASQSFSNQNVLTNDQSANAASGSSPGAEYATATSVEASQNDVLDTYTITAGGGDLGYASAPDGGTATSTGMTSFSSTFQVSTPEEFTLTGSLGQSLGSDDVTFSQGADVLYQASVNGTLADYGSAPVSFSLLLMPGVSYTLAATSSQTNNDDTLEQGINSFSIAATVPEPSTAAITLIAASSLFRRRRRQRPGNHLLLPILPTTSGSVRTSN